MDNKQSSGGYAAPEIEIIEIRSHGVLCASGGTEEYGNGTWTW